MYVCIYLSIYVSMYVCTYVCMYSCMCVYMYVCIRLALMEGGNTPDGKVIWCILAVCPEVTVSDARTVGGNRLLHKVGVHERGQHPECAQRSCCK